MSINYRGGRRDNCFGEFGNQRVEGEGGWNLSQMLGCLRLRWSRGVNRVGDGRGEIMLIKSNCD